MIHESKEYMAGGRAIPGVLNGIHWVVIVVSLAATVFAWQVSQNLAEEKELARFNHECEQIGHQLVERMAKYEDGLWGGVGMIQSHEGPISEREWRAFSTSLNLGVRYPGVNGLGVILQVLPGDLAEHTANRQLTRPTYGVRPKRSQARYFPVVFVEPMEANEAAIGLDMSFEATRLGALLKARDSGKAQITGPITLVQDTGKTPGFLFYAPYFSGESAQSVSERQSRFLGLVYAPFIVNRLMDGVLANENRRIGIRIADEGTEIYDEFFEGGEDYDPSPLFTRHMELPLYGRSWSVDLRSSLSFRRQSDLSQPRAILLAGIVIDVLIFSLFVFISRKNRSLLDESHKREDLVVALEQAQGELEDRVAARTAQLKQSNSDLQSFVYGASHDLRSPLRGIEQLSQWLEEDFADKLGPEGLKYTQLLHHRVRRMNGLLDALLAYNHIGSQPRNGAPVDLRDLFQEVVDELACSSAFEMTLNTEIAVVSIVQNEFSLVLLNLLSNAIKHHDRETGRVDVFIEDRDCFILCRVVDDGPGIPDDYQAKVFELFQTLKSKDSIEGSGIGLSLVKKQVKGVGGEVSIVSEGRGTEVRFTWPKESGQCKLLCKTMNCVKELQ